MQIVVSENKKKNKQKRVKKKLSLIVKQSIDIFRTIPKTQRDTDIIFDIFN